jgi:hypothetical protein
MTGLNSTFLKEFHMTRTTVAINRNNLQDGHLTSGEVSLHDLMKKLSSIIKEIQNSAHPDHLNEEWTKITLIVPLLEGLGWDKTTDIAFGPHDHEGRLDFILKCQTPIGIDARTIHETPPEDIEHPQIKNGLKQCEVKKAPYFIWTNGDCWQFYSLALKNPPFYQVRLSEIENDPSLMERLSIMKKDALTSHPEMFNKALHEKLKTMALPHAWTNAVKHHTKDILYIFRKVLKNVDIKDDEIIQFLKTLNPEAPHQETKSKIWFSDHGKWERLIDSHESQYRLARWFFRTSYYRKLGEYLIHENYRPWSKDSTWRHVGLPNNANERKKIDHAMFLFQEWGFIEDSGDEKYSRVEGCVPYLKQLLEKPS